MARKSIPLASIEEEDNGYIIYVLCMTEHFLLISNAFFHIEEILLPIIPFLPVILHARRGWIPLSVHT